MKRFVTLAMAAVAVSANAQVLHSTGFEYNLGDLSGQDGYFTQVSGSSYVVQDGVARSGSKAVALDTGPATSGGGWAWKDLSSVAITPGNLFVVSQVWVRQNAVPDELTTSAVGLDCYTFNVARMGYLLQQSNNSTTTDGGVFYSQGTGGFDSLLPAPSANEWHHMVVVKKIDFDGPRAAFFYDGNPFGLDGSLPMSNWIEGEDYGDSDLFAAISGWDILYWDDLRVEAVGPGTVQGIVGLGDWPNSPAGVNVKVYFLDGMGAAVDVQSAVLDGDGRFSVTTAVRGDYQVVVKPSHWLAKSMGTHTVSEFGLFHLTAGPCVNGDADGDNGTGLLDYDAWGAAFDSVLGDGNYNAEADFDGSADVTLLDYDIWSANFDQLGDSTG